jgi:hypothetical protein
MAALRHLFMRTAGFSTLLLKMLARGTIGETHPPTGPGHPGNIGCSNKYPMNPFPSNGQRAPWPSSPRKAQWKPRVSLPKIGERLSVQIRQSQAVPLHD